METIDFLEEKLGWEFFDERARQLLGIGGAEFLRRWDAGEYDAIADSLGHADIIYLALLGADGR